MCGTLAVEIRANSCDKTLRKAGGNKVMNLAPKLCKSPFIVETAKDTEISGAQGVGVESQMNFFCSTLTRSGI